MNTDAMPAEFRDLPDVVAQVVREWPDASSIAQIKEVRERWPVGKRPGLALIVPLVREARDAGRQPTYPTSDAYEAACAALEKHRARADAAETELAFIHRAMDVLFRADMHDEFYFNTTGSYAPLSLFIQCSDLFHWGTADGEPLTRENLHELEQAIADVSAVIGTSPVLHAGDLFCARLRGQRPQGAAYPKDERLWPLFDACGPERKPGLGNPYRPGDTIKAIDEEVKP